MHKQLFIRNKFISFAKIKHYYINRNNIFRIIAFCAIITIVVSCQKTENTNNDKVYDSKIEETMTDAILTQGYYSTDSHIGGYNCWADTPSAPDLTIYANTNILQ